MRVRAMDSGFRDPVKKLVTRPTSFGSSCMPLAAYIVLLFGNALEAYNLGSVPIEWLANVGLIIIVVLVALTDRLYVVPGSKLLLWFFLWGLFVTGFNILLNDYASLMPPLATTSYPVFVSLRFVKILSFISAIYLVYWLCARGHEDFIIKWPVIIGIFISVVAVYIYIAQVYGLPELPKTRMGTGGGQPSTVFSYAFHRATGTFREPSHLGEWLVLPFFLSLFRRRRILNIHTIFIGSVLLLTGSLTGIIGAVTGFAGAVLLANPFKFRNLKTVLCFALVFSLALVIFYIVVMPYAGGTKNLFRLIGHRLAPIITGGPMQLNRDYIYRYIADAPFPLFGYGLGHANILLSKYFGAKLVTSFLSLYFYFLFSTGILGLALLCLFLFCPVTRAVMILKKSHTADRFLFMSAAYFSWLVMFAVRSEEFTMMFAVTFALLAYEIHQQRLRRGEQP